LLKASSWINLEEKMELDGIEFEVSYRKVRYARVELKTGKLFLILPPGNDPKVLLEKHKDWIIEKKKFFDECKRNSADKQIPNRTETEFKELVLSLISRFSQELGVTVNNVSFKKFKSKWGICIPKRKNITFNHTLRYLPDRLLEYIVFHEIAHILERKHNHRFWNLIAGKFNDCQEFDKELISYQFKLQSIS
jgi:predicted metal-dependent hydrolase